MPHSQTATTRVVRPMWPGLADVTDENPFDTESGLLISVTTAASCGCGGRAKGPLRRPPKVARSEKGIRNFSNATNQSQYRAAAPFFLNPCASSQTGAAKSVDCQRWFSNGERSAGITMACPFEQFSGGSSRPP